MWKQEKNYKGNNEQKIQDYELREDEILMYKGIIYVPNSQNLKNMMLREMYNVPYVGHPEY
jgi:hypothetical protein